MHHLEDSVETLICEELYDLLMSEVKLETRESDLALQSRLEMLQWLEPVHLEIDRVPSELVLSVARKELSRVHLERTP